MLIIKYCANVSEKIMHNEASRVCLQLEHALPNSHPNPHVCSSVVHTKRVALEGKFIRMCTTLTQSYSCLVQAAGWEVSV
jgi:hypothetical protein